MTNLNEVIAREKGWKKKLQSWGQFIWFKYGQDGNAADASFDCPDYQGDANLYMQLFEEMPVESVIAKVMDDITGDEFYQCEITNLVSGKQIAYEKSFSIGEAVCLAWLKMKGIVI